ncbi:hypothetical protein CCUS01_16571, partial [Colletotrichum cuscutae]
NAKTAAIFHGACTAFGHSRSVGRNLWAAAANRRLATCESLTSDRLQSASGQPLVRRETGEGGRALRKRAGSASLINGPRNKTGASRYWVREPCHAAAHHWGLYSVYCGVTDT